MRPNLPTSAPAKALELMEGSLDIRLIESPVLCWQQRVHIALCICRALVHLHLLIPPMIHRDLKGDNVFLTAGDRRVKVGDLGLAAVVNGAAQL